MRFSASTIGILHIMRKNIFYWLMLSGAHSAPYQPTRANGTVGCAVRTIVAIFPELMNFVKFFRVSLLTGFLLMPCFSWAGEDFSFESFDFDIETIEKKALQWGGYAEITWTHQDVNQDSVFAFLNTRDDMPANLDKLKGTLQLDGRYDLNKLHFHWLVQASGQEDDLGWLDSADAFSAYASFTLSPNLSFNLGKKSYNWGKGYAWNPAGFINRKKDPDNPEESREGYITAEADFVKSFANNTRLQNIALTTVLLPVLEDVNEEFGQLHHLNLATKLSLLYADTDIDLLLFAGDSRQTRLGIDFSKNLATNFEIHGELAYIPNLNTIELAEDNSVSNSEQDALSLLLGLRYLSQSDITTIVEYYYNGGGYSTEEMEQFYDFAALGEANEALLAKARQLSFQGYGRPQPGQNYLYAKISRKEPFSLLYTTIGLITMLNVDDQSFVVTPELIYTRITNLEMLLRFSLFSGGENTEYGEKLADNKLELRLRYFF